MKRLIIRLLDSLFSKNIICSVGDIMIHGKEPDEGQLTVLSRYYDVKQYMQSGDMSFPFQNELGRVLYREAHDVNLGNQRFKDLIDSYEKNGYNQNSLLLLDKNIALINGTHRIAMNLWHRYWQISAKVTFRSIRSKHYLPWYLEHGLNTDYIDILCKIRAEVMDLLFAHGSALAIVTEKYCDESVLRSFMKDQTTIFEIKPLPAEKSGYLCLFALDKPYYKVSNNKIHSKAVLKIIKAMKNKYKIEVIEYADNCYDGINLYNKYYK